MEPQAEPSQALINAVKRVMRPLVRLLLAHGLTLPYFTNMLKRVFVEVAEQEFELEGRTQTDSRISLLTGVHRKDVRRLRAENESDVSVPQAVSLGAQVVNSWISDKHYLDPTGSPKQLPIRSSGRRKYSFETLVTSISRQDLRPRVVLDELLRLKVIELVDEDTVALRVEAFIPSAGFDEKAHYFGQNLRDHIAASVHNLSAKTPLFLDRAVTYHQLSESDVEELQAIAEKLAMESLKKINQRARQMKKRNENISADLRRINFGTYFYTESEDDER